jgi:hypothetical protein
MVAGLTPERQSAACLTQRDAQDVALPGLTGGTRRRGECRERGGHGSGLRELAFAFVAGGQWHQFELLALRVQPKFEAADVAAVDDAGPWTGLMERVGDRGAAGRTGPRHGSSVQGILHASPQKTRLCATQFEGIATGRASSGERGRRKRSFVVGYKTLRRISVRRRERIRRGSRHTSERNHRDVRYSGRSRNTSPHSRQRWWPTSGDD